MDKAERTRENVADCIYDRFVDAIVTGHLKSGAKLPTMQAIAAENGVTFRVARGVVERLHASDGAARASSTASITVRTKASRDWRRVVEPRTSGFDAAWWGLAGDSGYEVLWSNRKGTQTVTREFPAAGTVDTADLSFGTAGLTISVR